MVTDDPLAPTPSGPGDRPGAISGFVLILPLPQPGNCQGPKYRGPARSQARPAAAVSGLGKEKWERGPTQGSHQGREHWAGHKSQPLTRDCGWAQVLKSSLSPLLTLSPPHSNAATELITAQAPPGLSLPAGLCPP